MLVKLEIEKYHNKEKLFDDENIINLEIYAYTQKNQR